MTRENGSDEPEPAEARDDFGPEEERAYTRYLRACHGVQSATKFILAHGDDFASDKHLRTGLNLVMSEFNAVAELLVEKGVIARLEYLEAIADGVEEERARLTERARQVGDVPPDTKLDFA